MVKLEDMYEDVVEWVRSESGRSSRPKDAIDIGSNHWILHLHNSAGEWVGIYDYHLKPNGEYCAGFVPFKSHDPKRGWDFISAEPFTISPSLLCGCGSHGFIREGRWVEA